MLLNLSRVMEFLRNVLTNFIFEKLLSHEVLVTEKLHLLVTSGVAAIWTFWIYPGAAESEGAAKLGLK